MTNRPCTYLEALSVRSRLAAHAPNTVDPALWTDFLACGVQGALDRELGRLRRSQAMKAAAVEISESRDWPAEAKFAAGRASSSYIKRVTA